MCRKTLNMSFYTMFLLTVFITKSAFPAYIEGTDTTDVNGYSRDSSFRVAYWQNDMAYYGVNIESTGYFNYSFDDIKKVPDSIDRSGWTIFSISNCFTIKKKDSTYSKIKILFKLSDGRYVYKYGSNDTPKNRLLIKSDYDRSVRYKPNNFHVLFEYSGYEPPNPSIQIIVRNTCTWEPPLPNNNHLIGYIYYRAKTNLVIDTTKPIDIAQWDSIAFIDSTRYIFGGQPLEYFNIVAVYSEGKSDFLSGWSKRSHPSTGVKHILPANDRLLSDIGIGKCSNGFFINFRPLSVHPGLLSFSIYSIMGQRIMDFPHFKSDYFLLNTSQRHLPEGTYILKAEFPDGSVVNQAFMFTR